MECLSCWKWLDLCFTMTDLGTPKKERLKEGQHLWRGMWGSGLVGLFHSGQAVCQAVCSCMKYPIRITIYNDSMRHYST